MVKSISPGAWTYRFFDIILEKLIPYQILANDKWVAKTFDFHVRHENLSFAHHQEVAPLVNYPRLKAGACESKPRVDQL